MQQEPKNTTVELVPPPSIAFTRTVTEIPPPGQQTPISDYQPELVATNPTSPAVPAVATREGKVKERLARERQQREVKERLELMLVESRALRKDADLYKGNAIVQKLSSNIAYEHVTFMQQASGQKDSVLLRPFAAAGSTWTREIASRGGTSKRTESRDRKRARDLQAKIN
jgi:hypothetical protein